MMDKGKDTLQSKNYYKIEGGKFTRLEIALFNWLRATQRLWLWIESLITPWITKIFAARRIDFELVRRFEKKTYDQEKLILKLVDAFRNASEIYMALGEMGHGLMERADVLDAFVQAKTANNATIQIVHGPRVDPKTRKIFSLATNNVVELFRAPKYNLHHFSYVKEVDGRVILFDEGIHDETIWVVDENHETIPLFTSLGRHQYLISNSTRLMKRLKNEFESRRANAQKTVSPPERFVPSDYSPIRIFLTSTFFNLPIRHFIQPIGNYFDIPLGLPGWNTRKIEGVDMNKKLKWTKKISARHYVWFLLLSILWAFGLGDLLSFLLVGQSVLHWFNDLLVMFSSVSLSITVVMVLMEYPE